MLAFFSGMVASGDQVLLVYYIEERLGFTEKNVSYMFLIIGIMGLLAQGVLLKPLNDLIGEKMVVASCFLVGSIDNVMYGIARNHATIYIAVGLSALTGMAFPTISAIKANNVVRHSVLNCAKLLAHAQLVGILLYSVVVIFRAMGKNYDAAVIASGYAGLALGATPTAIAKGSQRPHKSLQPRSTARRKTAAP